MKNKIRRILLGSMLLMLIWGMCACAFQKEEKIDVVVRVGGLKGPTSMGICYMNEQNRENENWQFSMTTQADELAAKVVRGEVDIALIPANLAAVLYQKTQGQIVVIDINTLGVLYMVSGCEAYKDGSFSLKDLEGKTVYLTGMGTTPDYALQTVLDKAGIAADLQYKSEAAEVAAILAAQPESIGLLPQPFVTSATMQNKDLAVILDLNQCFYELTGHNIVTGVTIVRKEFLESYPEEVSAFLLQHEESTKKINENVEEGARLVVSMEILPKEAIAAAAIPNCNIVCIYGEDMKNQLKAYLEILYNRNSDTVGGKMPDEAFYGE